ncbi:putative enoyl-CoA hydratase/isomerase YngF [Caldovatus sediminis]|uniref:Putative enoyl-CoA hydratase/isomerase YngF n=1 Tax=Caldovatus sediminis TaxID=2041189 RepID=A0A8J3EEP4_9PROT|nr:enoyl-CoA hydratase/isomerase family protein [Caldovatus sediminis]GGG43522.1 putative enoyl-CoA hydratase/isomerase YngF [Caldovatus sediminis]
MNEAVLYAIGEDGVATLTLNRPAARNAVNVALCEALLAGARRAETEQARLVLVRAAGPVFSAGADLKERQGMDEDAVRARRLKGFAAYGALERLPMPAIAVVEGPAIGAGVEIAAACDFIVATPAASFRTPEALWGSVGATQRLPRVIGKRLAKDLMFTGRALSAEEAREAGLVARVVAPEALDQALAEITATILRAPPAALRLAKRCIDEGLERDPRGALATELMAIEEGLAVAEWRDRMGRFGR